MPATLIRYWFEFNSKDSLSLGAMIMGCGVTAYSYDDAIYLLDKYVFQGNPIPEIKNVVENIDLSTLDPNHILPNIASPANARGIWYPMGYHIL